MILQATLLFIASKYISRNGVLQLNCLRWIVTLYTLWSTTCNLWNRKIFNLLDWLCLPLGKWYFKILNFLQLKKYIFRNGVSLHSVKYCWKRNFNQFCEVLTLHFKASRGVTLLGTFHREHFFELRQPASCSLKNSPWT